MSQNEVAELSQEQKDELVQALKDKIKTIERDPEKVLESLTPDVRKRVEKLQEIQKKHDDFEDKFIEEREALEAKYEKLYQPLYAERSDIVNGNVEVEGVTGKAEEKGVPEFWLNVFKANAVLAQEISNRDEGALKYLKDIKWSQVDEPKGFKLEFFFDTNPYFKNTVLTKTYVLVDEDEIEKAIGTDIEWFEGKDLTKKLIQRKPKKGAKDDKPVTKLKDCDSFFNFFKPPTIPENVEELDAEVAEDLEIQMEQDYDIGSTIRDDIIPHAVSWFTGEAANDDDDIILVDGDDEDSDEESDEEEGAKPAEN